MPNPLHRLIPRKIDFAASGDNQVIPAFTGGIIRVHRMFIWFASATSITIKDGSTALTGAMAFPANMGFILDPSFSNEGWWVTSQGNAFVINNSLAVQVSGTVWYVIDE